MTETAKEKIARRGDRVFDYNIDEILLTIASDYGKKPLPNIKEALYCNIVNAVLEYMNDKGEKQLGSYHDFFMVSWERKANALLEEVFKDFGQSLHPKLKNSLEHMLKQHHSYERGESWYSSNFENWMRFWPRPITSIFFLTVPFVESAKEMLSVLEPKIKEQCEAIGKLMQKYVNEDIGYIRTHYHW